MNNTSYNKINKVIDNILKSLIPEIVNNLDELNPDDVELDKLDLVIKNWVKFTENTIIKQKPNAKCNCGSGKKFKKCCYLIYIKSDIQRLTKYEFGKITNQIVKLYNNTIKDGLKLVNPNEYLERQQINRVLFERLEEHIKGHYLHSELVLSSVYKYFKFMYDNYPPRMDYIINHFKSENKSDYDIIEIYYNLTK